MRLPRALGPPRLSVLTLLTLIANANSQSQKNLLCKLPGTGNCVMWLVNLQDDEIGTDTNSTTKIPEFCGFSDEEFIPYREKYVKVKHNEKVRSLKIWCRRVELLGRLIDWKEVENALSTHSRVRRQSYMHRGRYRGQTQSQYLAIDKGNGKDEGRAEAHSAADSSSASVSGNSGMGQAQSQSVYEPNCDDCYGKSRPEVENLKRPVGSQPGQGIYGTNTAPSWQGSDRFGTNQPTKPGTSGSTAFRPNGATTNGGYSPPVNGGGDFRPGASSTNNGYGPNGKIGTVPNGISNRYDPQTNSGIEKTRPGDYLSPGAESNSGLRPGDLNKYEPGTNPNGFRPTGPQTGFGPNSGTNRGPGGDNYFPNQGNIFTHQQGSTPPGTGGNLPQNGNYRPGQTSYNNQPAQSELGARPGTSSTGNGYDPRQVGTNYIPGYGNQAPGGIYGPVKESSNGFGTVPGGLQNKNWPITSGSYPVPGGTVYCCLVPNNGGGQTPNGGQYGMPGGIVAPGTQYIPGGSSVPGGPYTPGGNVDPSANGGQYLPGYVTGGINGPPTSGGQYIPGGGSAGPGGQYSIPRGVGGSSLPGSQYLPGTQYMPGTQYVTVGRPNGAGSSATPGEQYMPGGNRGSTLPGGQYTPSGSIGSSITPGGQYIPSGTGGSTVPGGQYTPGGTGGSTIPGGQYIPGVTGGSTVPGGQYTPGGTGGSTVPGGQYIPGGTGGSAIPGGQYIPGGTDSSALPGGQYTPGSTGGSTIPGGQYIPGGSGGSSVPGGQYTPGSTGGTTAPGGQYTPGGIGGSTMPGGQYLPGGTGGSAVPGGQYTPGSTGGSTIPGGQYITSGAGGSTIPGGQYTPGSTGGSTIPGGQYIPGGTGGSTVPGGQYTPGGTGGSTVPGGQYTPGGAGGSTMPGGQFRPGGTGGSTGPGGQYTPGGTGGTTAPGGQYAPGGTGGSTSPGGQYIPSGTGGSTVPGGQYVPGGTGGSISSGGQYIPGGTGGSTVPGGQYVPGGTGGSISPGGQYIPGGTGGSTVPGGQYASGGTGGSTGSGGQYIPSSIGDRSNNAGGTLLPGGQYVPGGGYGPDGSTPGGQYLPNGSPVDGGQYLPGGNSGNANPGGQYNPGGTSIPGNQNSPGGTGGSTAPGQYLPVGTGGNTLPGMQHGSGNTGGIGVPGGYGTNPQGYYNQGNSKGQGNDYNGVPQNYLDPNTAITDEDDSEAQANVAQNINGTTASASSKGGNDKGRAQTSVQGTYTGSGSFQAQAQITGDNKEAQSEVSGGKKGASSSATGSGRNNKSQANVELGSETGSVQTQSQSNGVMHSSNSQVQGSVKGGMADAQARGPGSTSSQAQIGFTPYKDEEKSRHDLQSIPFSGGGMASAQSSGRTGQSQTQLHGTFKYGITYNGAAQSGASLDKDAVFPNRLSFEKINVFDEKNKNINVDKINIDTTETPQTLDSEIPSVETATLAESYDINDKIDTPTTENVVDESLKNSESRYSGHAHIDHHVLDSFNSTNINVPTSIGGRRSFQTNNGNVPDYEFPTDKEDAQPEYETDVGYEGDGNGATDVEPNEYPNYDEYTRDSLSRQYLQSSNKKGLDVRQTTGGNTQHILLGSLKDHNAEIVQKDTERPDENKVYQPGERVPGTGGYTIPVGFTGSVKSVASKDKTYVVGSKDFPSQAQTVTLTPGTGKIKYIRPSSYGRYVKPKNLRSLQSPKANDNRYVSVSKSVTRALDSDNNIRKQYSHTYYTKSSSCGYFTFTCTMVSSAEGRKKVCKPKMPTNPDGSPIRC